MVFRKYHVITKDLRLWKNKQRMVIRCMTSLTDGHIYTSEGVYTREDFIPLSEMSGHEALIIIVIIIIVGFVVGAVGVYLYVRNRDKSSPNAHTNTNANAHATNAHATGTSISKLRDQRFLGAKSAPTSMAGGPISPSAHNISTQGLSPCLCHTLRTRYLFRHSCFYKMSDF